MSDNLPSRDYYCSMKFRFIQIDLESQNTYSCHAAAPHKVDFDWLSNNKGNIFNHAVNVSERQMMLDNVRAPSCEQNCWSAEDNGMQSFRLLVDGHKKTHNQTITNPEIVNVTVGSNCNLTCSYCCKEFSSSWRNDINTNGEYLQLGTVDNRYKLIPLDKTLMKIKQSDLVNTPRYTELLNEVQLAAPRLTRLDVTGGEPFLNNHLVETLSKLDLPDTATINIYSGLGVDSKRFKRLLDVLSTKQNIKLVVSAEGIEKHLEFNRYGVTWDQFLTNLQSIRDRGIKLRFHSVVTNLTVFGVADFYNYFSNDDIVLTFAHQPRMMAVNVLDTDSKKQLVKQFSRLPDSVRELLTKNIEPAPDDEQKHNMSMFLPEFVKRRPDINLNIYPESFLSWLGINNVV